MNLKKVMKSGWLPTMIMIIGKIGNQAVAMIMAIKVEIMATKVIKEIMAIKVEIMAIKEALVTYVVMSFLAKVIIMDIVAQRDVIL